MDEVIRDSTRLMDTHGHTKEQYYSFGSSSCIDFEVQDELHCSFGHTSLRSTLSICAELWCMSECSRKRNF
jgi:hypothetical protein